MELGIDLLKTAASFLPAVFGPAGGGAPGVVPAPGLPTTPVGPGGGVKAQVSPTLQTRISPQISPTMTQIQSSPGAGVMAAPQQVMPGAMTAGEPGAPPPMQPQYGYSPQPVMPGAVPSAFQPTRGVQGINWTPIIVAGVVAVAALGIFGRRRKKRSK